MSVILLIFFVIILIFGAILLVFITSRGKQNSALNVNKFRSAWLAINQQLTRDNESSYALAILNADKLLDSALKQSGFKGDTMGERMKSAAKTWSNANAVWSAHKLRNQIAHETEIRISYDQTRRALASFKQALKDVGAI